MSNSLLRRVLLTSITLLLTLLAGWFAFRALHPHALTVETDGGFIAIIHMNGTPPATAPTAAQIDAAIDAIRRRVDPEGDQSLQISSKADQIEIKVPSNKQANYYTQNAENFKRALRGTGALEFRIVVSANTIGRGSWPSFDAPPPGTRWFPLRSLDDWIGEQDLSKRQELKDSILSDPATFFISRRLVATIQSDKVYILLGDSPSTSMTRAADWGLASVGDDRDEIGKSAVRFVMNNKGAALLNQLTRAHVGEALGVLVDDELCTAPNLNSAISRQGIITGLNPDETRRLITILSHPLPLPITSVQTREVPPAVSK